MFFRSALIGFSLSWRSIENNLSTSQGRGKVYVQYTMPRPYLSDYTWYIISSQIFYSNKHLFEDNKKLIDLYIGFEVDCKEMKNYSHQLENHEIRLVYIILQQKNYVNTFQGSLFKMLSVES